MSRGLDGDMTIGGERVCRLLLRLYPAGWRARYGDELAALVLETSGGGRVPWRVRLDLARGAGRERLRALMLGPGGTPEERMRGGALVALCAWAAFVVAGIDVQKLSEHWQDATPVASRGLPAGAFDALPAAAAVGSALVLAGVAAALPAIVRFLRAGGWLLVRRHVLVAVALTAAAAAGAGGLAAWAHGLTPQQRNGHDVAYAVAVVLDAALLVGCLAAWTVAAVAVARRLHLTSAVLRAEAWLAAGTTLAMAAMTVATAVWWGALARSAPAFLGGIPPALLGGALLMAGSTLVAAAGSVRALRAT